MAKKKWLKKATENKGGLHRSLGIAEGKKIPAAKLAKAKNSENPKIRKEAVLAETMKHFSHKNARNKMYGEKK